MIICSSEFRTICNYGYFMYKTFCVRTMIFFTKFLQSSFKIQCHLYHVFIVFIQDCTKIVIKIVIIVFLRLKYTFGPYFCQNYSIWSLFWLFVQFSPRFGKITFN